MSQEIINLILLALLGSVAGLIGGVIFLLKESWAKTLSLFAVPFAAGVLISVSLLDLLPEAAEINESAFQIALLAFFGAFIFEKFLFELHHHEHHGHDHHVHENHATSIPLVVLGDTIHNLIDGIAIGAAYLVDPSFGLLVALATFLHETPHEIADFGVLISSGWSRTKTFTVNVFSALATLPGALFVYFYAEPQNTVVGTLLAVAAGLFLYLGAADFLPDVLQGKRKSTSRVVALIVGVVLIYIVSSTLHFE